MRTPRCQLPLELPLLRLKGGRNNRVFRSRLHQRDVLVKQYFSNPSDSRDRFGTERAFYDYMSKSGIRGGPAALAWDEACRIGVFEFVEGSSPLEVTPAMVSAALSFVQALNAPAARVNAQSLPYASEACFSLDEHIACVSRRVNQLREIRPETSLHERAIGLVENRILAAWSRAVKALCLPAPANRMLPPESRCVSPSDFGFHNAIVSPRDEVCFLDFEYAGWDDPTKLVCDFFNQPDVPVPLEYLSMFVKTLEPLFGEDLAARVNCLLPLYRVKWLCILMNEFLPGGQTRRRFASRGGDQARRARQLSKIADLVE